MQQRICRIGTRSFSPPNPGTLTEVITIPATCQAGERFYVYLKDWNKCNPFVNQNLDYVYEDFIIEVIDAPPIPVVTSPQTYCFGSVPATITATPTVAGNTINWYSDATLTTLLHTGNSYTHGRTAVGTYTYYATQTSGVNGCEGPAVPLTLVINPIPNTPTISRNNPDFCFDGVSSITLTANPNTPPAITSYQWYRNGTAVAGATSSTIVLSLVAQSGNYTVRTFGIAPTFCPSPLSAVTTVTIGNPATVNAGADQNVCSTVATVSLTGTRGGSATSSTWSTSGTGTFANASALNTTYTPSAADRSGGSVTITLLTNDPAGPCPAVSDAMVVTFSPAATVNAGPDQSICALATATLAGVVGGGATGGTWSGGTGTYNPNANTLNAIYTPSVAERTAGTVTLTLTTNDPAGPCGSVSDNMIITIGAPLTGAVVSGSGDACDGASSWFAVNVAGGSPPFVINYTFDGAARPAVSGYTNGTHISLGTPSVNSHTVRIISIQDACLNLVPVLPADYTFTIYAIPNAGGTVNNTPALCNNTATDIVLQSTIPASDFVWTVSNAPAVSWVAGRAPADGTRLNGIGTSIAQTLQHTSTFPTTVTYSIQPRGPGATACLGPVITRTVIVNPYSPGQ